MSFVSLNVNFLVTFRAANAIDPLSHRRVGQCEIPHLTFYPCLRWPDRMDKFAPRIFVIHFLINNWPRIVFEGVVFLTSSSAQS